MKICICDLSEKHCAYFKKGMRPDWLICGYANEPLEVER
jgi:hypothetical protein